MRKNDYVKILAFLGDEREKIKFLLERSTGTIAEVYAGQLYLVHRYIEEVENAMDNPTRK